MLGDRANARFEHGCFRFEHGTNFARAPPFLTFSNNNQRNGGRKMSRYKIKRYIVNIKSRERKIKKTIKHYNRKERYMERDLKRETVAIDMANEQVVFCASREDSFERLSENDVQFVSNERLPEDVVIEKMMVEKLLKCLALLDHSEQMLIKALYFQEKTERQLSEETGVHYSTIHSRKKKILEKLKKMLEK